MTCFGAMTCFGVMTCFDVMTCLVGGAGLSTEVSKNSTQKLAYDSAEILFLLYKAEARSSFPL